ncbi:class I SAM-dependent methyltransferase [Kitasatospora sp. NPDC058046]|uniref:class I SAM-dependent methyltransferase n=1 Tax=Kitasatospora sp. NPDC058046 TaxID=3346312 RepID=UPI0036D843CD
MNPYHRLTHAYDPDNNSLYAVLRMLGWGELLNLGYFTPLSLLRIAGGLSGFQEDLVTRSLDLLRTRPGEHVLDVACGTGRTTVRIAERGARATGVDLYPPHLEQAVRRHGDHPRVRFLPADATDMSAAPAFADASFDRVYCLEAAFHFGPDGRQAFLREAYRVLKPGGRLVLVDFAWATDDPTEIRAADPDRTVRDTWAFEEFEPLARYLRHAADAGYRIRRVHDWTRQVIWSLMTLGTIAAYLARTGVGRRLLGFALPPLRDLPVVQWPVFARLVRAHTPVRRFVRYVALVLDKPI